ncbi:MAG: ACT domain-containing protein [Alphaproteobacteria bacterium]|nr:ACT domain-containing protein [Alphaproteobacteria bacterium]
MNTYVIDLHERAGSLERLLNVCRRKGFTILTLSVGATDDQGLRRLVVAFDATCPPSERVLPNLARLHDVAAVEIADTAAAPAVATLQARTRAA